MMNQFVQAFCEYIQNNPRQYGNEDINSVIYLIYDCFTELNPIDTEEIRAYFGEINDVVERLTVEENDCVFSVVCQLCSVHERLAFVEGFRMGMQLMMEINN